MTRRYVGNQDYVVETIATADDYEDADGARILTFWQAQDRARAAGQRLSYSGPYRVKDAVEAYRKHLGDKPSGNDTNIRLELHILPALGEAKVHELTAETIRDWHRNLAKSQPLKRTVDLSDPEMTRKRQVSANRVLGILKAALNLAFRDGKVASDSEWRRVRALRWRRAEPQYLSDHGRMRAVVERR